VSGIPKIKADLAKLEAEPGWKEWSKITSAYRKGRPVLKSEVLELLRNKTPVPSHIGPLLADIIERKSGITRHPNNVLDGKPRAMQYLLLPRHVSEWVDEVEAQIVNRDARPAGWDEETHREFDQLRHQAGQNKSRRGTGVRAVAERFVADLLEVNHDYIKDAIKKHRGTK